MAAALAWLVRARVGRQVDPIVRLLIDTDPGVDDALAIMLAAAHPQARIEALTTVAGNVTLERTTGNACIILDVLGLDVPVYPGSPRPLVRPVPHARNFHGQDGLGDSGMAPSSRSVESEHAALAMIRLASTFPGELTLVAIGPLSNLALATRLDPELPSKFKQLAVSGGAVRARGGTLPDSAEFNMYADPEAAHIVLESWPGLQLLPWDTAAVHTLPEEQVGALLALNSTRAEFLRRITAKPLSFSRQRLGKTQLLAPDGLAMAAAIEPDFVRRHEARFVQVELTGSPTPGQTTVDWNGQSGQAPNADLILEVNRDRFRELLHAALA